MASLSRHRLSPAETGPALRALRAWTPPDAPSGSLHPGDVGWLLRRDDATVFLWTDARTDTRADARADAQTSARAEGVTTTAPVAVGFLDGPVLRVTTAPDADLGALAADAEDLLVPGNDATDGLPVPGWEPETEEPWLVFSWTPEPVSSRAVQVTESDTADRALVHRAAFTGSTLTADHWRTMKKSPAGHLAVETLVRTPAGKPAAAATGWFGGAGRCGLLEPVGTHTDHRGHGYGRDAVRGACAALADRGASAVAVLTPASNEAAVALYKSAGFTVVRENHDWTRPRRCPQTPHDLLDPQRGPRHGHRRQHRTRPPRHRLPRLRRRLPPRHRIRLPPQTPPPAHLARRNPHLIPQDHKRYRRPSTLFTMGMCIDVLIVDWDHLMSVPEDQHYAVLHEAGTSVDEEWWDAEPKHPSSGRPQWFWPAPPAVGWFGKFDFGDVGYSYKDHFWAGERWEEIRSFVEPGLRSAVDRYIDPLFWGGLEYMSDRDADVPSIVSVDESRVPSDHLLWCRPAAVSSLKRLWDSVDPELGSLRGPFGQYARADFGSLNDFDAFAELLRGWGDVIGQAELRGWGVVGLRC